ncbi:MAG: L-aspartate oxidase [Acidimicrobiales bacterium]
MSAKRVGPFDVLVVGSGVAGLSVAVRLATEPGLVLGVLTKGELSASATRWAQGGVAAVLSGDEDSTDLHMADTLAAGAGLCDVDAVRALVNEGPRRVDELIALGAAFDREASGDLALAREGGHSRPRILHAGGAATGAEVERALVEATRASAGGLLERWFALDLVVEGGRCVGVLASRGAEAIEVRASNVVLATGGAGQMFAVTTNPPESTADGLAMALRAGVPVADVEFMQFHPTALHHPAMPRPLLSEALRGHGAMMKDLDGQRFVDELAPRDVVSRAMAQRMAIQGADHLWLDATALSDFAIRFPTIASSLQEVGLDPATDWLPIAPAAHHLAGGILTDLCGASGLPGLWAVGEVACSGVHGANRLASNSLLEGMVFGARVADALLSGASGPTATGAMRCLVDPRGTDIHSVAAGRILKVDRPGTEVPLSSERLAEMRSGLQVAMTAGAGVVRDDSSLETAQGVVEEIAALWADAPSASPDGHELGDLLTAASALLSSARARSESRGAHTRSDFPQTDASWRSRLVHAGTTGLG